MAYKWTKVSNGFDREQVMGGLSGDTKPTGTLDGIDIDDGAYAVENNTGDVYDYVKATSTWALFG